MLARCQEDLFKQSEEQVAVIPFLLLMKLTKLACQIVANPSSALLEVLDPEQNHSFYDNYLGVHF